tara:strand:- start:555 stop:1280 length:726 start_codon:yes stop_codon:yes gene_type:complete
MTTKIPVELSSTPGIDDSSNATAITIDSSENVIVGATSYNNDNAGVGLGSSGFFYATRDGSLAASFKRLSSTGSIADFRKDSSTIASVTSDGICFGSDSAAANALDDYEEGIHVATITCGTSGTVSLNGAYSDLSYTKIGRLVTVTGFIIVSAISSPVGYYSISLPFTSANLTDRAGDSNASIHQHYGNNVKPSDMIAFLPESSSQLQVYRGDVGVTRSETSAEDLRVSTQIVISVTYTVA